MSLLIQTQRSQYFFTLTNVDSEHFLKDEIRLFHPKVSPSFMKKGFVSFKANRDMYYGELPELTFARRKSLFLAKGTAEVILGKINEFVKSDQTLTGIHFKSLIESEMSEVLLEGLKSSDTLKLNARLERGQSYLHLIQVSEEDYWLGLSHVAKYDWKVPEADPRFTLPEGAPSRSYLKILEAMEWSGADVRSGDLAIEIGASPGGACLALLEKGLKVVGVDRAEMDIEILRNERFRHQATSVHFYDPQKAGEFAQWILLDMSNKPRLALPEALRLAESCRSSLLGMFLTLKLNEDSFIEYIPEWISAVKEAGFMDVVTTQLPSNRSEIHLFALSKKGKLKR